MIYNSNDLTGLTMKDANYVQLEIVDLFPHDHPLLFDDAKRNADARKMQDILKKIVKNQDSGGKFHAFVFVFDVSEKETYNKLLKMIHAVLDIEKS